MKNGILNTKSLIIAAVFPLSACGLAESTAADANQDVRIVQVHIEKFNKGDYADFTDWSADLKSILNRERISYCVSGNVVSFIGKENKDMSRFLSEAHLNFSDNTEFLAKNVGEKICGPDKNLRKEVTIKFKKPQLSADRLFISVLSKKVSFRSDVNFIFFGDKKFSEVNIYYPVNYSYYKEDSKIFYEAYERKYGPNCCTVHY